MKLPIYQVDAFTAQRFAGNPAAVCPVEHWPDVATMQAIAAANNLSETAFIRREGERYTIRWFTPKIEVDLCGHATLAAGYVINQYLQPGRDHITFDSRSGPLSVTVEGEWLTLDFPVARLTPAEAPAEVVAALGAAPVQYYESDYPLAIYERERDVAALTPDFRALAKLVPVGIIATAPGETVDFVSRFFAPAAGIDEDPVTGSAHCVLTPFWAARQKKQQFYARQISARGGDLRCALAGNRVHISGQAVPYLRGKIEV